MAELISAEFAWLGNADPEFRFYDNTVSLFFDAEPHVYYRYEDGKRVEVAGVTSVVHILDKSAALTQWSSNMACDYVRTAFAAFQATGDYVITPELIEQWLGEAKYAHKNYKEAAGETGHIAHDWIERFIKLLIAEHFDAAFALLNEMPDDVRAANGCVAALDFMAKHRMVWIFTERKIYSKEHDFAGTMDGLAYVTACGDADCCGVYEDLRLVPATFTDVLAVIDWKTSNGLYDEYHYQAAAYLKAIVEELGLEVEHRFIARLGKEDAKFEARYLPPDEVEPDFKMFLLCLPLYRAKNDREAAEKAQREAVKALRKAEKEAAEAAAKAEKARIRAEKKEARIKAKMLYKEHRAAGATVKQAEQMVEDWLATRLLEIGGGDVEIEEETEAIAA